MNLSLDKEYMTRALYLAKKGIGKTSPNPLVGAVIVKNKEIIGEGFHKKAGEDHAEIIALKDCKESTKNSTLYVTLEPCSHYGKTPPCVDAIIKSGIKEVFIAVKDPNPLVNGKSISKLKKHGIKVNIGILEKEATELNKYFFKFIKTGLPYVHLKAAITLDGKIATRSYDSRWISCEESRRWVHKKRTQVDAVLIGVNTAIKDNPRLNSRLEKITYPKRVILDTDFQISSNLNMFSEKGETIIITTNIKNNKLEEFKNKNIKIIVCKNKENQIDLKDALRKLGEIGITSILVEGGGSIFSSFISKSLVDRFYFFIAPKIIGDNNAISVMDGQNINLINESIKLKYIKSIFVGEDILIEGEYANEGN